MQEVFSDKLALERASLHLLSTANEFLSETKHTFTTESAQFYFVLKILTTVASTINPSVDSLEWLQESSLKVVYLVYAYPRVSKMMEVASTTSKSPTHDTFSDNSAKNFLSFIKKVETALIKWNSKFHSKEVTFIDIPNLRNLVMVITEIASALSLQDKVFIVTSEVDKLQEEYVVVKEMLKRLLIRTDNW